jgi:hypothetical protein
VSRNCLRSSLMVSLPPDGLITASTQARLRHQRRQPAR